MTDDWRISQKFSINFGVRWDYQSPDHRDVRPPGEPRYRARLRGHRPGSARPIRPATRAPCRLPWSSPDKNNISPRIGFAWRPIPKKYHGRPRRLRHLLQHFRLQQHRQQHGAAAALRPDLERRHDLAAPLAVPHDAVLLLHRGTISSPTPTPSTPTTASATRRCGRFRCSRTRPFPRRHRYL